MASRGTKPNTGKFDPSEKVNSNTLKRHPKQMDLSRNELLQLLSYLEGELQARDVVIATLKAEKAKQLLYQAKYGRFGLGDPFTAMQRDSDNMKDNTFDESAIKSMYDNQLAQLENLIATQRKAQMKMRDQMILGEKRYHKVCSELDEEKRKHAQDTAQGDDVTYMLEKERERLTKEIDFEKASQKKMEKDMKKTLASLEEERANSSKHKQVALMLIKERKKLVEKLMQEKYRAEQAERILAEERNKAMNMAEGLVQESKKSLKMEATMERQASEFDLEREQLKNKLLREENRNKELQAQIDSLAWHLESVQKQLVPGKFLPKDPVHSVEIKSNITSPPIRLSSERTWPSSNHSTMIVSGKSGTGIVEREAGLSPRQNTADLSVRKRDTPKYASPQTVPIERGHIQYSDNFEQRVAPVGAVSESKTLYDSQGGQKLNVSVGGPTIVSSGGRITVQTGNPMLSSGPISPRRAGSASRGTPPPIPPNKPILPATTVTASKPVMSNKTTTVVSRDGRQAGSKPVHIPVSVVHTSTLAAASGSRTPQHEGSPSPSSIRKPTQKALARFQKYLTGTFSGMIYSSVHFLTESNRSLKVPGGERMDRPLFQEGIGYCVPSNSTGMKEDKSLQSTYAGVTTLTIDESATQVSTEKVQLSASSSFSVTASDTSFAAVTSSIPVKSSISSSVRSSVTPVSSLEQASTNNSQTSIVASSLTSQVSAMTSVLSDQLTLDTQFYSELGTVKFPAKKSVEMPFVSLTSSLHTPLSSNLSALVERSAADPVGRRAVDSVKSLAVSTGKQLPESSQYNDSMTAYTSRGQKQILKESITSPIHRYAATGNIDALRKLIVDLEADVNLPMKDGTTPAHCAAENGQEECLSLLIQQGCQVNSLRDDQQTPVHCAASQGHIGCLRLLLMKGGNSNLCDHSGWSPLHWAAANGRFECCKKLLANGSKRLCYTNILTGLTTEQQEIIQYLQTKYSVKECRNSLKSLRKYLSTHYVAQSPASLQLYNSSNNWTPFHIAVHSGFPDVLELLLTFEVDQSENLTEVRQAVCSVKDKDGSTLCHLASSKKSHDCISVILQHCDIDIAARDCWGRTVLDVSSPNCRLVLMPYVNKGRLKNVPVELQCTGPQYSQQEPFVIGHVTILPRMTWADVDLVVTDCVESYFDHIDCGLKTKKTSRLDPENNGEDSDFTLGLNAASICAYIIGNTTWNRDNIVPDIPVQQILGNLALPKIIVNLKGSSNDLDSLAFDLLLPLATLHSFTRLLDQYKCVVFYGPEGTMKKQLVKRLARHIAEKEKIEKSECRVTQVYLHRDFQHRDFLQLLKSEGCILPAGMFNDRACILLLFHLEKVQLAEMLGSFVDHIEHRGTQYTFPIPDIDVTPELYYFPKNFYLICTMDKPRSTGLDLALQQRFRLVHFRVKVEPIKNLLGRHLLRRLLHTYGGVLPSVDDTVFRVVEWLICVWQRLNDGVSKLGLPDVVFGPEMFLPCPVETQNAQMILDWLRKLWNETIAPAVKCAVLKGTGKEVAVDSHQKVANTALYVLMQRAIVPGCPLNGQEKDEYLSTFSASNELDVPLKSDKHSMVSTTSNTVGQRRSLKSGNQRNSEELNHTRSRQRNSTDGNLQFSDNKSIISSNTAFKRRSLSDNCLSHTDHIQIPINHEPVDRQHSDIQAKVPKLEISSPVLGLSIPLLNTFSSIGQTCVLNTFTGSHNFHNTSHHRRSTFSSHYHSRIPQSSTQRSRSSESLNLSNLRENSQFKPTSPFSFSLAKPTASLFSFNFNDEEHAKPN